MTNRHSVFKACRHSQMGMALGGMTTRPRAHPLHRVWITVILFSTLVASCKASGLNNPAADSAVAPAEGTVTASTSQISLSGPSAITAGNCIGYAISGKDSAGNISKFSAPTTVNLNATGSGQFFSDPACLLSIASVSIPAGSNAKVFYFLDNTAESAFLVASTAAFGSTLYSVAISAAPAKKLVHAGPGYLQRGTCSSAFTILSQNAGNAALAAPANTPITLSGSATSLFYSDAGCSSPVTTIALAQNANSISFYLKDSVAETVSLNYAASGWLSGSGTVTVWGPLSINPTSQTLATGNSKGFAGVGGAAPYSYSVVPGSVAGTLSGATYTAPGSTGSATVRVTDAVGNTANAPVTIVTNLAVNPLIKTLLIGGNFTLSATGGAPGYTYTVTSGTGIISAQNGSTGSFVAPGSAEIDSVTVTDSLGNTSTCNITVMPAPLVEILFDDGQPNWTQNSGTTNSTHTRAAFNNRSNLTFSALTPAGTSSTRSVDFGNGGQDVALDLLQPGGLKGDYYTASNFSGAASGSRVDNTLNSAATVSPWPAAIPNPTNGFSVEYFGRISVPVSTNYVINSFISNPSNHPSANASSLQVMLDNVAQINNLGFTLASNAVTNVASVNLPWVTNTLYDLKALYGIGIACCDIAGYGLQWKTPTNAIYPGLTTVPANYLWASIAPPGLQGLSTFTLTGWLNNRNSAQDATVILNWQNGTGSGVDLRYRTDGSLSLGINQAATSAGTARSSTGKVTTDASVGASNWVFFAVTYDSSLGSNQVSFYFGQPGAPAALDRSVTKAAGSVGTPTGELTLGNFNSTNLPSREGASNVYRGLLDDVRIYGSALSVAQIQAIQNF